MRTGTSIAILILFSALLFLVGLGAMPLTDPDETFYAETAKEMLNRREFLTPYIFGKPQFEKPPLYYWSVMLPFAAFGVNEFSARISSALFGILGVLGIYFLGKLLVNKRTGFFAGIILATSIKYLVLSRACVTDMLLGVLILYAFLFFFYRRYLVSSFFLALAVLTKGPIGIFLPVVIIGIYLLAAREIGRVKEIPLLRGTVIFLAATLPWYILMHMVHGGEFIDVFFGFHNITRFMEPEHAMGDVFYYYIPVMIGGFLPWAAFLPLGIWQIFREKEEKIRKTNLFLIAWFLVIFIFFSFSRTKLPTYIFPLYPVLALLIGRLFDVFLQEEFSRKMEICMKASLFLFLALIAGGVASLYIVARMKYPTVADAALAAGGILILTMLFFVTALLKRRYAAALIIYMASFVAIAPLLAYIVLPELGKYESSKIESEKLLTLTRPGEKLGAETRYIRGVAFYTGREDVLDVHPHHVITKFLAEKERVWCLVKEKNHIQLYEDRKEPYARPTYVVYRFGKKVIVTNKVPPDGKFLKMRSKDDY